MEDERIGFRSAQWAAAATTWGERRAIEVEGPGPAVDQDAKIRRGWVSHTAHGAWGSVGA